MKNLKTFFASLLAVAVVTGLAPQKASAVNALDEIALGAVIVGAALLVVAADNVQPCSTYGYLGCSYYEPSSHCRYSTVTTEEVRRSCRDTGYFGGYQCATIQSHSETYIRSCH